VSATTHPRRAKADSVEHLERLRLARIAARASLTECALLSGLARWRVQEIFAGSVRPKPEELRLLERTIRKLDRAYQAKKALLRKASAQA
jgi:hypothetical protein